MTPNILELTPTNEWEQLSQDIQNCKKCDLYKNIRNKVISRRHGCHNPPVLFVGEAPGEKEDKLGLPFVGRSGNMLNEMINYMNLKDFTIINAVKCRPPNNRNPSPDEIKACSEFFYAQIKILNPKIIVLLGETAIKAFGIDKLDRGKIITFKSKHIVKVFHPAALLRNRSRIKVQETYLDTIVDYINKREILQQFSSNLQKTAIFEQKYGVDIKDFSTTTEINDFIEKKEGKKLEIID